MNKVGQYILATITCAFIALIAGIFIGRHGDFRLAVHADDTPSPSLSVQNEKPVYSDEIYIDGKMNINAAGKEDLSLLPGIGDTLAQRIIAFRRDNGYFKDIDDLLNVEGLGEGKLARIREYIVVGKAK